MSNIGWTPKTTPLGGYQDGLRDGIAAERARAAPVVEAAREFHEQVEEGTALRSMDKLRDAIAAYNASCKEGGGQ